MLLYILIISLNDINYTREANMTKDENMRLNDFNKISQSYIYDGYTFKEKGMGILKANLITFFISIPFFFASVFLFKLIHKEYDLPSFLFEDKGMLYLIMGFVVLIIVHELLHGLTWSIFTPNGIKDIAFGFVWKYLTPYASCRVPLYKSQYLLGVLMPFFVLGLIPTVVGFAMGNFFVFLVGIIFILAAGGDIIMTYLILSYKKSKQYLFVYDHPTKMAVRFFEK